MTKIHSREEGREEGGRRGILIWLAQRDYSLKYLLKEKLGLHHILRGEKKGF